MLTPDSILNSSPDTWLEFPVPAAARRKPDDQVYRPGRVRLCDGSMRYGRHDRTCRDMKKLPAIKGHGTSYRKVGRLCAPEYLVHEDCSASIEFRAILTITHQST